MKKSNKKSKKVMNLDEFMVYMLKEQQKKKKINK